MRRFLLVYFSIFSLAGCGAGAVSNKQIKQKPSGSGQVKQKPESSDKHESLTNPLHHEFKSTGGKLSLKDRKITNALLNEPLLSPVKQKPISNKADKKSDSKAQNDVLRAEFNRGKYLTDPYAKPKKNSYLERYGRVRLEKAATIKRYSPVTILPVQLEAHCSTAWDKGKLHVRVAYYGPKYNLNTFMNETRMLYISFQDEAGTTVYKFDVPITQMKKAPPEANYGQPTYEVEGQLPLALEVYEEFFQWNIEWQ